VTEEGTGRRSVDERNGRGESNVGGEIREDESERWNR
jgi:hypothetical protein